MAIAFIVAVLQSNKIEGEHNQPKIVYDIIERDARIHKCYRC